MREDSEPALTDLPVIGAIQRIQWRGVKTSSSFWTTRELQPVCLDSTNRGGLVSGHRNINGGDRHG